jgi:hypothetical protein
MRKQAEKHSALARVKVCVDFTLRAQVSTLFHVLHDQSTTCGIIDIVSVYEYVA